MDLTVGLQLKTPRKMVPWRVRDLELQDLFDGYPLKKVKRGYYTLKCEPLDNLHCFVGFHLHEFDVLTELEFFVLWKDLAEIKQSYEMFQRHLEAEFGQPESTRSGREGFADHEWLVPGARIIHLVRERHGPEELVRILKTGSTEPSAAASAG